MLYRGASGKVVALDDRCCHRAAPLSMGRIEGDDIRCMYHGMKFDPAGKCIQIPGQDMIPAKLGVRSYPVVERYNLILIWMGEAEKADPNLIVDYPPLADPKWRGLPGYMHYKANWLLIVDNLSDFRPSRLRAHPHARRLRGIRLQDQAGRDREARRRFPRRALAHERRAAALS